MAERAGVSIAAVHSYFRTRRDLIAATLASVEQYLLDMVNQVAAEDRPAREALTRMVRSFDRAAQEQPDVLKVWLDWSTGVRTDVWHSYLPMQQRVIDAVLLILRRGQRQGDMAANLDLNAAARLFVGGGHTVALARFADASQSEIEVLITYLVESVVKLGQPG